MKKYTKTSFFFSGMNHSFNSLKVIEK